MNEDSLNFLNKTASKNSSFPKSKVSDILTNKSKGKSHIKTIRIRKNYIKKNKFYFLHCINAQLQKHNSSPSKKDIMIINNIINTKSNHFLAVFKDFFIIPKPKLIINKNSFNK